MDYGYGNQYNTSYGAQGRADGGGFVDGEPQSSPAGGKRSYDKDTVRPVTIKQILDAEQSSADGDFKIDGDVISQVTFVGQIRNISTQTTNVTYKLDDGTGLVEVKQWIDGDKIQDGMDLDSKPKLALDGYCRVWGRLKDFNNNRYVGSHVIRPIQDYNEINYHLLEATAVHLFFTRGPPVTQANGQKAVGANGGAEEYGGANGAALSGCSALSRKVYKALQDSNQSNEGVHVQMLASQMGLPVNEVYKGAEDLLARGVIFTTVDDNTWALLDG